MSEQWKSFVSNQPILPEHTNCLENDCIFNLSDKNALLELSGEDVKTYLQGQLTNDINSIDNESSQLSGYCNPKGRLLALFRIFTIDDRYYLQFPAELADKLQKRLQMFVMMSKVAIKNVSDEYISIALSGNKLAAYLKQKYAALSNQNNSVITIDDLTIITISGQNSELAPRYLCFGNSQSLQSLSEELIKIGASFAEPGCWVKLDIQQGLPCVVENTVESFVPQMLNLHLLDGINFKKGCYTGQEVVARMHYLGKLKRLMYQLKFPGNILPEPGDSIYSPLSTSGQGAGTIVMSSWAENTETNDKEIIALAVVEISNADNDAVYMDEDCTVKATLVNLPYSHDKS